MTDYPIGFVSLTTVCVKSDSLIYAKTHDQLNGLVDNISFEDAINSENSVYCLLERRKDVKYICDKELLPIL